MNSLETPIAPDYYRLELGLILCYPTLTYVHLIYFSVPLRELVNQLEVTFFDKSTPLDPGFTLVLNQRMNYMEVSLQVLTANDCVDIITLDYDLIEFSC